MVTRRRMLQAAAILPASESVAGFGAVRTALTSAPIAGHFPHESVRLWLQTRLPPLRASPRIRATVSP
jgi:hypothetical protein